MFCVCTTGSCAISALVGPFSPEMTKSRDRKRSCPALLFFRIFFPVLFFTDFFHVFFSLYFFPRIFFRTFFRVIFFPYSFYPYFFHVLFIPVLFGVFFQYYFSVFFSRPFLLVVVVQNVGWGCSLRRPRPIAIGNYHPFYFHILSVLYDVRVL